eukprot:Clim_evm10s197 gene=Clim_evmTU10s197
MTATQEPVTPVSEQILPGQPAPPRTKKKSGRLSFLKFGPKNKQRAASTSRMPSTTSMTTPRLKFTPSSQDAPIPLENENLSTKSTKNNWERSPREDDNVPFDPVEDNAATHLSTLYKSVPDYLRSQSTLLHAFCYIAAYGTDLEKKRFRLFDDDVKDNDVMLFSRDVLLGEVPIHTAARLGLKRHVQSFITNAAVPKAMANQRRLIDGATPLHLACVAGHVSVVRRLLRLGAEVETEVDYGAYYPSTALGLACYHGHYECVRVLIEWANAPVNRREGMLRFTPLMWACASGIHEENQSAQQPQNTRQSTDAFTLGGLSGSGSPSKASLLSPRGKLSIAEGFDSLSAQDLTAMPLGAGSLATPRRRRRSGSFASDEWLRSSDSGQKLRAPSMLSTASGQVDQKEKEKRRSHIAGSSTISFKRLLNAKDEGADWGSDADSTMNGGAQDHTIYEENLLTHKGPNADLLDYLVFEAGADWEVVIDLVPYDQHDLRIVETLHGVSHHWLVKCELCNAPAEAELLLDEDIEVLQNETESRSERGQDANEGNGSTASNNHSRDATASIGQDDSAFGGSEHDQDHGNDQEHHDADPTVVDNDKRKKRFTMFPKRTGSKKSSNSGASPEQPLQAQPQRVPSKARTFFKERMDKLRETTRKAHEHVEEHEDDDLSGDVSVEDVGNDPIIVTVFSLLEYAVRNAQAALAHLDFDSLALELPATITAATEEVDQARRKYREDVEKLLKFVRRLQGLRDDAVASMDITAKAPVIRKALIGHVEDVSKDTMSMLSNLQSFLAGPKTLQAEIEERMAISRKRWTNPKPRVSPQPLDLPIMDEFEREGEQYTNTLLALYGDTSHTEDSHYQGDHHLSGESNAQAAKRARKYRHHHRYGFLPSLVEEAYNKYVSQMEHTVTCPASTLAAGRSPQKMRTSLDFARTEGSLVIEALGVAALRGYHGEETRNEALDPNRSRRSPECKKLTQIDNVVATAALQRLLLMLLEPADLHAENIEGLVPKSRTDSSIAEDNACTERETQDSPLRPRTEFKRDPREMVEDVRRWAVWEERERNMAPGGVSMIVVPILVFVCLALCDEDIKQSVYMHRQYPILSWLVDSSFAQVILYGFGNDLLLFAATVLSIGHILVLGLHIARFNDRSSIYGFCFIAMAIAGASSILVINT